MAPQFDLQLFWLIHLHHSEILIWYQVDIRYGLAADTLRSLILNDEACR